MGAFLRKLARAPMARRNARGFTRDQIYVRDQGRLFEGSAPNAECVARRKQLMAEWDRWIAYFRKDADPRKFDPQALLRWLRATYLQVPRERLNGSRVMKFIERLNEARSYENKVRSANARIAGTW